MNILTVCGFAAVCLVILIPLRAIKPEFALIASGAVSLLLLAYVLISQSSIMAYLEYMKLEGWEEYFEIILKALGITLIGYITSEICRDFGEASLCSKIELASKLAVLYVTLPVFDKLLLLVRGLLA